MVALALPVRGLSPPRLPRPLLAKLAVPTPPFFQPPPSPLPPVIDPLRYDVAPLARHSDTDDVSSVRKRVRHGRHSRECCLLHLCVRLCCLVRTRRHLTQRPFSRLDHRTQVHFCGKHPLRMSLNISRLMLLVASDV